MSDERSRQIALAWRAEIRDAIELLARHGYQVWHDGAHVVSEYEQEQKRERERARAELRQWLDL